MTVREPTHQEIAARAYELYLQRGRQSGHEMDDWLQAEYELMQLPVHKLAELEPSAKPKRVKSPHALVELVRAAMLL